MRMFTLCLELYVCDVQAAISRMNHELYIEGSPGKMANIYKSLTELIGGTPLLEVTNYEKNIS